MALGRLCSRFAVLGGEKRSGWANWRWLFWIGKGNHRRGAEGTEREWECWSAGLRIGAGRLALGAGGMHFGRLTAFRKPLAWTATESPRRGGRGEGRERLSAGLMELLELGIGAGRCGMVSGSPFRMGGGCSGGIDPYMVRPLDLHGLLLPSTIRRRDFRRTGCRQGDSRRRGRNLEVRSSVSVFFVLKQG